LHICEIPGNFIAATNHYFRQHNKTDSFTWFGNSLNPNSKDVFEKYGEVFDDSYGYVKKYPDNWLWGPSGTGDITDIENIKYFEKNITSVDFFTSDCGQECVTKKDMLEQEKKLSILTICQFFICLLTLKEGGNGVFKVFLPLAEDNSISYVKFLSNYFEELIFVKQAAGSPGSSEIYIIAKNKTKQLESAMSDMIYDHIKTFNNQPLPVLINNSFKTKLYGILKKLVDGQINYLHRSFYYYDHPEVLTEHSKNLRIIQYQFVKDWIKMVNITPLDDAYKL
jgi:hypothetical protein